MLYKIKSIKHSGTCGERDTERTDGRYPLRIDRVVKLGCIEIGYPLIIQYVRDSDGTSMEFSLLKTSNVKNYIISDDEMSIETENSIFEFERVDDE